MTEMTIGDVLASAAEKLQRQNIPAARLDAEVLLSHILRVNRAELYINKNNIISEQAAGEFNSYILRRMAREPVAYITGEKEFMSLSFLVNRDVLIPRPETEVMVEWITGIISSETELNKPILVDVGTGSGAIAISIARYLPEARVWAVDISDRALDVARSNADRLGVVGRVTFMKGDLLSSFPENLQGQVDIIAANLPYIPSADVPELMPDVAGFEPFIALDGGSDGLDQYRKLIPQAMKHLKPGGWVCLEMGLNQTEGVIALLSEAKWRGEFRVLKDYAGHDRFMAARKQN